MKIGMTTSVIERGQSGIGQYVLALTRELLASRERHQFVFFVLEQDLPLFDFVQDAAQLVPVSERYLPPLRDILWHQTMLPKLARQHGLDVLHVPTYRRMLWRRPCALVATIHDLAQYYVTGKYDMARMFYGRVVSRFLASRQHRIVAISRNTARDIANCFGLNGDRVTVVPNGINHQRFSLEVPPRKAASPFFLYVSRLEHPAKNHVRLIAAFERFKRQTRSNWELIFAGKDAAGAAAIHAAIADSPYRVAIRSLGFVGDEDLPSLYRSAGAFVYPSLYEGFGLPPLEAMACGCPVLCSPRGALAEVVGDAALFIAPESVSSIATQLTKVATKATLRRRLRQTGVLRARAFNWGAAAAATLEVYARAAQAAKRLG